MPKKSDHFFTPIYRVRHVDNYDSPSDVPHLFMALSVPPKAWKSRHKIIQKVKRLFSMIHPKFKAQNFLLIFFEINSTQQGKISARGEIAPVLGPFGHRH
jgi:hypothetical protein